MKSLLRPLTRANPYTCDPGGVDQLAGPDELGPGSRDLAYALEREVEVGFSRVAAVLGPFRFSWGCACLFQTIYPVRSREEGLSRP